MPKALSDARIKLTVLPSTGAKAPKDWRNPTVAELNAGTDISQNLLKSDYKFGPTGSDTVDDTELTAKGNAVTYGAGNFEASLTPFRYLDADGKAVVAEDKAYQTLTPKGTEVILVERRGPEWEKPFAAGDVVNIARLVTDNPQPPSSLGGYLKAVIPMGTQDFELDVVVGAGA